MRESEGIRWAISRARLVLFLKQLLTPLQIETTLYFPQNHHEKISLISSLQEPVNIPEVSTPSSTCSDRQCRICLLCHETKRAPLISACRCSGTVGYVHKNCLVRWIDVSSRKICSAPRCEICNFKYKRRGVFTVSSQ